MQINATILILTGTLLIIAAIIFWAVNNKTSKRLKALDEQLQLYSAQLSQTVQSGALVAEQAQQIARTVGGIQELVRQLSDFKTQMRDLFLSPSGQGYIGETMLEVILKDVLPPGSWEPQYAFKDNKRVDAVIKVGDRIVPIDAKFPVASFRSHQENSISSYELVTQIKRHINAVAGYIRPSESTFDFALMYIPSETIYYNILNLEGNLLDSVLTYAAENRVIIVSPRTLWAYLQVIILGFRGLHLEKNAREILNGLSQISKLLQGLEDPLQTLGRHLQNAFKKYDEVAYRLQETRQALSALANSKVKNKEDFVKLQRT